jgi:anti-sigma regulatory factor (Ser/Thr protein kinase)
VKEVSGVSLMVAHEVPASSTMALPHGPSGVAEARRKLRKELGARDVPEPVIDDAVLVLSELLTNSFRHARPLEDCEVDGDPRKGCGIRAAWTIGEDGLLGVEVTDGGGATRPRPSSPSLSAHGGRGLGIVGNLALRWGVRDAPGEVTTWALLPIRSRHARRADVVDGISASLGVPADLSGSLDGPLDDSLEDSLDAIGSLGNLDSLRSVD